ncbi:uncharacterized protein LY89DRAFT_710610 [Mollisia scopiformis]|uniref:Uncharacterized protein n=1 Tax=Mollisia scopiformis TaxID=149040 RepID=A0A132BEE7_MOLSC|nr:uncharacterized protein LY89DRAFT_710610 [Mollisia scopiformis]KUJ10224.1 hypothetical protein LY89DRAFT_710610 [Mollisia scopiformis]
MLSTRILLVAAVFTSIVSSQTLSTPFCDSLTAICYTSYTTGLGISYRIALPDDGTPEDVILQVVAPVKIGWAGFAWGGTMPWNPLSVGWSSGTTGAIISSRRAFGLNLPLAYDKAQYTYLRGTGTNSTHWTVTVRCQGCTSWQGSDGSNMTVPLNGTTTFAYAYAISPPLNPADNSSGFNVHDNIGKWVHDVKGARSSKFSSWIANNIILPVAPISSSSTSQPSSTTTVSTTTPSPTSTATVMTSGMPTLCPGVSAPKYPSVVANGWRATKVKGGMAAARGVVFDSAGHLLVVESGLGITAHTLDGSGCVQSSKTVVSQANLNHGISFDANGTTLFASSMTVVWSWTYDPVAVSIVGSAKTVIKGMFNSGHPTRSLLMSPSHPNTLLVSHGASGNIDYPAGDIKTGRAMIRVFDLSTVPVEGYNYSTDGYLLAYGLRNAVGIVFDRNDKLWVTENGSDELTRTTDGQTVDIHGDNPAEELNYIGDLAPSTNWYGFPTCYSVWKPSDIRDRVFGIGDQFVLVPNATFNDSACGNLSIPPRLTFQAHSAPLDTKFDRSFANMYVAFHGSWDRDPPTGYKVVEVPFFRGRDGRYGPVSLSNSTSGYRDIWSNVNVNQCSATQCFRPAGIVFDHLGRMYVTSDASGEGEMWLLGKI